MKVEHPIGLEPITSCFQAAALPLSYGSRLPGLGARLPTRRNVKGILCFTTLSVYTVYASYFCNVSANFTVRSTHTGKGHISGGLRPYRSRFAARSR